MDQIKCSTCKTEAEYKVFSSFSFWYCPVCKDELLGTELEPVLHSDEMDFDKLLDEASLAWDRMYGSAKTTD
jgi:ribosomal protein L37AE/L43A